MEIASAQSLPYNGGAANLTRPCLRPIRIFRGKSAAMCKNGRPVVGTQLAISQVVMTETAT